MAKYSPSIVADPRDEMCRFVMEELDDLQEECHSVMPHKNINISCPMMHARRVKESRAKRKDKDPKRAKPF